MRVIDGVHRVLAARSLGQPMIPAVFFHGTETEASLLAIYCNIAHGKPLTLAEREAGAASVLRAHSDWSDRRIAAVCGLSPQTVGHIRREAGEVLQSRRRVGRDGKARATDPAAMRRRIAEAVNADPMASIRAIAARTSAAQGTVRDVKARLMRGDEVLSPRQAAAAQRQRRAQAQQTYEDDQAYLAEPEGRAFTEWLQSRLLTNDGEWEAFLTNIPISRSYEIADAARQCAEVWRRFAAAVEARTGGSLGSR
ncbi:MAG: hypothetical protein ACRD2C_23710 [Acidimicrobiales bacterium]